MWPIIVGQMASARTSAATAQDQEDTTRDVERFRQFLDRGAPGPHAYVVLLAISRLIEQPIPLAIAP